MPGRPSTKLAPPTPKRSRGAAKYTPKCPPLTTTARRVRCLGIGDEHSFVSPDPASIRICPDCRDRIRERMRSVSPTMLEPLRVASGGGRGDDS